MRSEAEYCTCIVKSLNEIGTGYKIPDPSSDYGTTSKRCFDIIGRIKNQPVYCEAKFNKSMCAFNLNRIEEHQARYLDEFLKVKDSLCYIALGVQVSRGDCRSYIFDWKDLSELYKKGFSIHAKYLEKLPYNKVHKGLFSFDNIITIVDLKNVYGGEL